MTLAVPVGSAAASCVSRLPAPGRPASPTRVLVVGWELPEYAPGAPIEAANYRTWQLVEPLRRDGHHVCVVAGRVGSDFRGTPDPVYRDGRRVYIPLRFSDPSWMVRLQAVHDELQPHCIVAVTFLGALRASRLRTSAPIWMDIYGDQMAEMQAKANRVRSDRGIATQLGFYRAILARGDVFSTCSAAQRHALVGQLSMTGRLDRATFGYEFAFVIPPGAPEVPRAPVAPGGGRLSGRLCRAQDRVALWCGGYNAWTDVECLYRGLDSALSREPRLHFVSVGGPAAGCDAYARFERMVSRSPRADRFHLLGWRPAAEVPSYYAEADVGISLDAVCYEAELGTRTRLVEMMAHGLPIVTTEACELSHSIRDAELGFTFPAGDSEAMARQIVALCIDDPRRQEMSRRARAYAATTLSVGRSTAPLRAWVRDPVLAPDRGARARHGVWTLEYVARALARQTLWSVFGLDH